MIRSKDAADTINFESELRNTGLTNAADTVTRPRHRWYYYKEGFSPILVEKAIEAAGIGKNDIVLDIFNGSGTTTLAAAALNRRSVGIEVNPFTRFLSEAKIKNASAANLARWSVPLIDAAEKETSSPLIGFSTFSKSSLVQAPALPGSKLQTSQVRTYESSMRAAGVFDGRIENPELSVPQTAIPQTAIPQTAIPESFMPEACGQSSFPLDKWLFNDGVLTAFEGAWEKAGDIPFPGERRLLQLALISAAMENCNAVKDGKCLRYRAGWKARGFDKKSFIESFKKKLAEIADDVERSPLKTKASIIYGDSRIELGSKNLPLNFKLCITSPPYLNTFDYTDIYRPELFLGKFVKTNRELEHLRLRTVRSHIQIKWREPKLTDFGRTYKATIDHINANRNKLMHRRIPLMIQAYFEDMFGILGMLRARAATGAAVWMIVSNSAYANTEIPVDIILGEIAERTGWRVKEIAVLKNIKRRKTVHSPDIKELRESALILTAGK